MNRMFIHRIFLSSAGVSSQGEPYVNGNLRCLCGMSERCTGGRGTTSAFPACTKASVIRHNPYLEVAKVCSKLKRDSTKKTLTFVGWVFKSFSRAVSGVSASIVVDTLSSHVITFSTTPRLTPSTRRVCASLLGFWATNPNDVSIFQEKKLL